MAITDYAVRRDRFEADDVATGLAFPCCFCIHRHGSDQDEPCRRCDHNALAEPEPSRRTRELGDAG